MLHLDNLNEIISSLEFPDIIVTALFLGTVVGLKNYLNVLKEVYAKSEYTETKSLYKLEKSIIILAIVSVIIAVIYTITIIPYSFGISGDYAYITKYDGGRTVKIPSRILFWKVIGVSDEAFSSHEELERVIFPDCLHSIGKLAFSGCTGLTTVDFPSGLTNIDNFAFADCKNLKNVTNIPKEAVIYVGAFCNTRWLYEREEDYVIVNERQYIYIGDETEVTVPDGMIMIDFYMNKKIKYVNLPESITRFNSYCFQGCSNLEDIKSNKYRIGAEAYSIGGCPKVMDDTNDTNVIYITGSKDCTRIDTPIIVDENFRDECRERAKQ